MRNFSLKILFLILAITFGCGVPGESKLDVTLAGKTMPLVVKSSETYNSVKTFNEMKDGQNQVKLASANNVVLGNYDIDTSSGMSSMEAPVTAADQIRVAFMLVGQEGTDEQSGFKTGSFTTRAEKFNKVDFVSLAVFTDGKESKNTFDIARTEGEVKTTSVTGESISGEINLTEGEKSIRRNLHRQNNRREMMNKYDNETV